MTGGCDCDAFVSCSDRGNRILGPSLHALDCAKRRAVLHVWLLWLRRMLSAACVWHFRQEQADCALLQLPPPPTALPVMRVIPWHVAAGGVHAAAPCWVGREMWGAPCTRVPPEKARFGTFVAAAPPNFRLPPQESGAV